MNRSSKPIRVLMLLENAGIPEDHRVVREAEALMQIGCTVSIICPTVGTQPLRETVNGIEVYRFPHSFSPDGLLGYVWEYGYSITMFFLVSVWIFVRRGFDVIHVHTPPDMTAVVAVFFQLLGKKFVFDHHDLSPELYLARREDGRESVLYRVLRFFERFACTRANRLIATNTTQQNVQIQRCGAKAEHCYVVRNGPNESFLKDVTPRPELVQPGRIMLGYVGIIGIQDGVDYMLRVVQELKYKHRRNDFLAVIVGHGTALADLKVLAKELEVEEEICFTGRVPFADVPSYIAAFDICFTPDPSNPYNDSCTTIKTMEYMALRKPTICFRTKENEITAGEAALYADNNDVFAFAALTIKLMDDPSLRASMGEQARQRIDEHLTWQRQSEELKSLYRDLVQLTEADVSRAAT
jgi:glycosyltransferase involved in cell wall biosynthesis